MSAPRVVVIGAGVTGLTTAVTLQDEAHRARVPLALTVVEASAVAGGHAQTTRAHGFVVEAGPNGFLNREPETLALVETLGLQGRLVEARPEAARRYILRGGTLRPVPSGPASLVTSPALSWRGKLRLLYEPFAPPPPSGEESVHAFAARRLGHEAADVLVDTAVSGISAGDSRRLSVAAQFPRLAEMERAHGSLLRAMFARRPAGAPSGPSRLLSFDHGMGVLTAAMAERLGPALRTGTAATALSRTGPVWQATLADGTTIDADHVVVSSPARRAGPLVDGLDGELAAALRGIEYAGLAVVALAYRVADVPRALDGYGYLATRPEGLATLGVVWESSLFPGRAPDGMALLRVMLGGSRRPDLVTAGTTTQIGVARAELARVMGVRAEPQHAWAYAWPEAIAQYTIGHLERRQRILEAAHRHPGLWLCGTSYDGVAFNDAVKSARATARQLADRLWAEDMRSAAPAAALAGVRG